MKKPGEKQHSQENLQNFREYETNTFKSKRSEIYKATNARLSHAMTLQRT